MLAKNVKNILNHQWGSTISQNLIRKIASIFKTNFYNISCSFEYFTMNPTPKNTKNHESNKWHHTPISTHKELTFPIHNSQTTTSFGNDPLSAFRAEHRSTRQYHTGNLPSRPGLSYCRGNKGHTRLFPTSDVTSREARYEKLSKLIRFNLLSGRSWYFTLVRLAMPHEVRVAQQDGSWCWWVRIHESR